MQFLKGSVFSFQLRPTKSCRVMSLALVSISRILKDIYTETGQEYCLYVNQSLLRKYNLLYVHLPIKSKSIQKCDNDIEKITKSRLPKISLFFNQIFHIPKESAINMEFGYMDRKQKLSGHYSSIHRFNKEMAKIEPSLIYD